QQAAGGASVARGLLAALTPPPGWPTMGLPNRRGQTHEWLQACGNVALSRGDARGRGVRARRERPDGGAVGPRAGQPRPPARAPPAAAAPPAPASAPAPTPAAPDRPKESITFAIPDLSINYIVPLTAVAKGFFDEAGLSVQVLPMPSNLTVAALQRGDLQL